MVFSASLLSAHWSFLGLIFPPPQPGQLCPQSYLLSETPLLSWLTSLQALSPLLAPSLVPPLNFVMVSCGPTSQQHVLICSRGLPTSSMWDVQDPISSPAPILSTGPIYLPAGHLDLHVLQAV